MKKEDAREAIRAAFLALPIQQRITDLQADEFAMKFARENSWPTKIRDPYQEAKSWLLDLVDEAKRSN